MKKQYLFLFIITCFFLLGFSTLDGGKSPKSIYSISKVVIDAGHGGKDPGCNGKHSREKEITLAVALKLGKYIQDNIPDVEVIYTRTTDVFVELNDRAEIANKNDADLFISIHCNAHSSTSIKGTETYVMGLGKSKQNLEVAKRENEVILLEDDYLTTYDGFDPNSPETQIIFNLYQNAYLEQSILFANMVEKQFKERAKRSSRGVKQANFVVLYKTAMPSVLVESGFLTHRSEEQYLLSDEGQSVIASAMYRAFKEFKAQVENEGLPEKVVYESPQPLEFEPEEETTEVVDESYREPEMRVVPISNNSDEIYIEEETTKAGTSYRVQLYSAKDNFDVSNVSYEHIEAIEIEKNHLGEKYYLANEEFNSKSSAAEKVVLLKKSGFPYAKVIKYENNERSTEF